MNMRKGGAMFTSRIKPSQIYPENKFQQLLQRELRRTERYGSALSWIVFQTSDTKTPSLFHRKLVTAIAERVRSIDEIGMMGTREIGVILSGADDKNARKIAVDITEKLPHRSGALTFSVFSHSA